MTEHEGGQGPGGRGKGEVLAALSAPRVQAKGREPLEDGGSTGSGEQEGEDGAPEVSREGDQESRQWNRLRLHSIEGEARDAGVEERDGIINHLSADQHESVHSKRDKKGGRTEDQWRRAQGLTSILELVTLNAEKAM